MTLHIFSDFCFITSNLSEYITDDNGHFVIKNERKVKDNVIYFIDKLKKCYNAYIKKKLLVRGGISFGKIMSHANTLVGEAVTEAVRLEENGMAPVILFPAYVFESLNSMELSRYTDIPIKNDRILYSSAILPSDLNLFLNVLKTSRDMECYNMTIFSGKLDMAYKIVRMILKERGDINSMEENLL